MVVPTYLGTMALGGMGMSLNQYNSLLMSNMGQVGLQMSGLQEHTSGYSCSPAYQQFQARPPLPTQVLQQPSLPKSDFHVEPAAPPEGCHLAAAKSYSPEPEQASPPPVGPLEEPNLAYLAELEAEKERLEAAQQVEEGASTTGHLLRLLENEISHVQSGGSRGGAQREHIKYFDIYRERPVRLTVRALIPVREHPKFNFVGKLLGPKGNSMKRLQEETMTKMAVLGRGSMRDKQKEEELRSSADPKYQHLAEDLHVEITAFAPPAEAHARIAYALTEVRKYLIPDSNDEIRQEQMREMELISTNVDVIDSLKQPAAPQLILHPFPGQVGQPGAGAVLHPASSLGSTNGFLAAQAHSLAQGQAHSMAQGQAHTAFLTQPQLSCADRGERVEAAELSPPRPAAPEPWSSLKSPPTYHPGAQRAAAACPYSKPA